MNGIAIRFKKKRKGIHPENSIQNDYNSKIHFPDMIEREGQYVEKQNQDTCHQINKNHKQLKQ